MQKTIQYGKADLNYTVNLSFFKKSPCVIKDPHNMKLCPFFHSQQDYIRQDIPFSQTCLDFEVKGNCEKGENCERAHNFWELNYTKENYKKTFCKFYPFKVDDCEFSIFCAFAHSDEEIKVNLIHKYEKNDDFYLFHFKTVMCPFILFEHERSTCIYAHNLKDLRRKPNLAKYKTILCEKWKEEDLLGQNYEDICKRDCEMSHGWLERDYHPLEYKTKPCSDLPMCYRGHSCPKYHEINEKRVIEQNVLYGLFSYAEENRLGSR